MQPATIKMEEPLTIEQKLEEIGEFIQSLCQTEEEYQELMSALHQKMLKLFTPVEQPNQMEANAFAIIPAPVKVEFHRPRRTRAPHDYNLFLQKITPNQSHSIEELTQLYNETFDTEITTRGFGKLKETKENFFPTKSFKNGKYITAYVAKK